MNIAIVTVYDSIVNFGSFLQAYALGKVLTEAGHTVYYVRRMSEQEICNRFDNLAVKQNKSYGKSILKKVKNKIIVHREQEANKKRFQCLKKDWDCFSIIEIEELKKNKIDIVICGSDEIWNLHNSDIDFPFYSCSQIQGIPKLAYAISSGDTRVTELLENSDYLGYIGDFNCILPRDTMTQELVKSVTGEYVDTVCDPTILLGKDNFTLTDCGKKIGKYMLVYSYYLTMKEKNFIKKYARENHLKIVSPCIYVGVADEIIYTSALNFPSLIAHAECVYTTTFHGAIFSLMYAKKMCCSPRLPKVSNLLKSADAEEYSFNSTASYKNFCDVISRKKEQYRIDSALEKMKINSEIELKKSIELISKEGYHPLGVYYRDETRYYYGFSKDEMNGRSQSSSGGLFYELTQETLKHNGVVFGAVYDPITKKIEHRSTDEVSLQQLLRSKYVESDLGNSFEKIIDYLKQGRDVLFCGTPCQAAGLHKLRELKLNRYPGTLMILDFLCEGVPSTLIFQQYLNDIERKKGKKVKDVVFRSKYYGWSTHCMKIVFEDDSVFVRPSFADPYMHTFIMDLTMNRPSCYQCAFRIEKVSDITLGDFWKVRTIDGTCIDDRGVSAIFVHSERGDELLKSIADRLEIHQLKDENIADMQQFLNTEDRISTRNNFYQIFVKYGFQEAVNRYSTYMYNEGIVGRLKKMKQWIKLEVKRNCIKR